MKPVSASPQESEHKIAGSKVAAITLVLAIMLIGCTPAAPRSSMEPPPGTEPSIKVVTPTDVSAASQPVPGQTANPTPFAMPADLPSKGSSDAPVLMVIFCDFI